MISFLPARLKPSEKGDKNDPHSKSAKHIPLTKPKLIFAGYFGAGNIGDEAILSAQIANLKPYFDILVLSLNPKNTANTHKVNCAKLPSPRKPREITQFFRKIVWCDAFIIGGGGFLANKLQPFSIYYWLLLMTIARLLRKKIILFSVGCGPFKKGFHALPIRFVLNRSDIILLRDSVSEDFIKQMGGVSTPTKVTADIAFLLEQEFSDSEDSLEELIKHGQAPRILFVLCPRFHARHLWKGSKYKQKYLCYVASMGKLADFIIDKINGTPILLPFYQEDVPFYIDILKNMKYPKKAILLTYTQNINAILSLFQKVDVVVGARYHSIIFSVLTQVPVLPIIYHSKCYDLVKELNLRDVALEVGDGIEWPDADIDLEKASQNLLKIYADKEINKTSMLKQKEELKRRAMENILALRDIFYSDHAL